MNHEPHTLTGAIRDGVARGVAAVGMAGIGLIHLLDAPGKFSETPYLGWMYVGLIGASVVVAYLLIRGSSTKAWWAAATLAASAMIGFTLTRTIGLPQAMGDIGNWSEPLGMASLFVEGAIVALSAAMLADRRLVGASTRKAAHSDRGGPVRAAA